MAFQTMRFYYERSTICFLVNISNMTLSWNWSVCNSGHFSRKDSIIIIDKYTQKTAKILGKYNNKNYSSMLNIFYHTRKILHYYIYTSFHLTGLQWRGYRTYRSVESQNRCLEICGMIRSNSLVLINCCIKGIHISDTWRMYRK